MTHLEYCRDLLAAYCEQWVRETWQQIDERLYRRAEAAGDAAARNRLFAAMQEVRFRAESVRARMTCRINDNFEHFSHNRPLPSADSDRDGDAAPEESLVIGGVAARATVDSRRELWQLDRRLAVLRGGLPADDDNPCAPAVICGAFRNAVAAIDVDIRIRLVIYDVFAVHFQHGAPGLYRDLNRYLADAGVLANLRFTVIDGGGEPAATPAAQPADTWPPRHSHDTALFTELCELVGRVKPRLAASQVGFRQLLVGCIQVQRTVASDPAMRDNELVAAGTVSQLIELHCYTPGDTGSHDPAARLGVALMGQLFEWLTERSRLPRATRCLLSYLHAPYLKLAVLDAGFFSSPHHPARQLLDLIALSHASYQDSAPRTYPPQVAIVDAVHRIAMDLGESLDIFDQQLLRLTDLLRRAHAEASRISEREISAQQGMAQLLSAQREASKCWRELAYEHALSTDVNHLLQGPISNFLSFAWLRHGSASVRWQVAQRLAQGVAVSVRGDRVPPSIDRYRRGQFRLLALVKRALLRIGYDGMLTRDLRDAIYRAQVIAARALASGQVAASQMAAITPGAFDTARDRLKQLSVGAWYRIGKPGGGTRRVRLAWQSIDGGLYLFTLATGDRFRLFDAEELGQLIDRNQVRSANPIDPSISTTALGAIHSELHAAAGHAAVHGTPTDSC